MKHEDFIHMEEGTLLRIVSLTNSEPNQYMKLAFKVNTILRFDSLDIDEYELDMPNYIRCIFEEDPYVKIGEPRGEARDHMYAWWYAPEDLELYEPSPDVQFINELYKEGRS